MKKKLLVILSLIVIGSLSALGLSACGDKEEANNDVYHQTYNLYVTYTQENSLTTLTYEEWLATIKGKDGKDGIDGKDGKDGVNGQDGKDGADGKDGETPSISTDGYWIINGEKTTYKAVAEDGSGSTISVNSDGYWVIDGDATTYKAGVSQDDLYNYLKNIVEYDTASSFEMTYEVIKDYFKKNTSYVHQWSTNSAWGVGGMIGHPQNFNSIKIRLYENPGDITAGKKITQIEYQLRKGSSKGEMIVTETIDISFDKDVGDYVINLPETVANENADELYFAYRSIGTRIALPLDATKTHNIADPVDTTLGTTNVYQYVSGGWKARNVKAYIPVEVGVATPQFVIAQSVIDKIVSSLDISTFTQTEIMLPNTIYTCVGQNIEMYLDLITAYTTNDVYIGVSGVGKLYADKWVYTPTEVGTKSITVSMYSKDWKLLNSKKISIVIANPDYTGKDTIYVLQVGASSTAGGQQVQKIKDLATDRGEKLELIGTVSGKGDFANAKTEGRAGWKLADYLSNDRTSSDTGATSNPFWNPTTNQYDFSYYMSHNGFTKLDVVILQLGINDLFNESLANADSAVESFISNMDTFIAGIHAYDSNIKIIICGINACCLNQTTFGEHYGAVSVFAYMAKRYKANVALYEHYKNTTNVYVSIYHTAFYPTSEETDGYLHPKNAGYAKLGTSNYYFIEGILYS